MFWDAVAAWGTVQWWAGAGTPYESYAIYLSAWM
jgi:hypothetical protein